MQLADKVECCGGSAELLQILNCLGITASLETLKRHIHNVSEIRKQTGIDGLLVDKDKAFTIASADNIDFLSSYAAVYSGCQHRSWHATSVQLVQPRPQSCRYQSQSIQLTGDRCDIESPDEPTPSAVTDVAMHTQSTAAVMPTPMTVTDLPMRTQTITEGLVPTCGDTAQKYQIRLHRKRQERSSPCSSPHKFAKVFQL